MLRLPTTAAISFNARDSSAVWIDSNGKRARISRRRLVAKSSGSPQSPEPEPATPTFAIGQLPRLRPAVRARVTAPATGYCTSTVVGPAASPLHAGRGGLRDSQPESGADRAAAQARHLSLIHI